MAITPSDFSKIWASNADTPEYTFNEADYLKGWDFVGNFPPTRAMWNAMQKSTDEKMKYVFDNFGAPLTASTVAEMTMQNRVYVYTGSETGYTAGHWYYWNGSAWTDGGVYNSTAFSTDTTLTISGQAADAKATGDAVAEVRAEASLFGIDDLLWDNTNPESKTQSGVTFTVDKINKTVTISGTATGTAILTFFAAGSIPAWLQLNKKYYIRMYTDTSAFLRVSRKINGTWNYSFTTRGVSELTLDSSVTNISIEIVVLSGNTVNTVVRPFISEAYSLSELENKSITNVGTIPDGDLNELSGNIVGLLASSHTYINLPISGFIGTIYNIEFSSIVTTQLAIGFMTGNMYYRKKTSTLTPQWTDWVKVTGYENEMLRIRNMLPENTDLNTIADNSVYGLQYGTIYNNLPISVVNIGGFVSTYRVAPTLQFQTIHATYPYGKQYIRQGVSGIWGEWFETGKGKYAASKKYVAFGDSLTWGSVWPATQGEQLYRATEKYRIPTRIALATGLIDNFVNEGVGGLGYVHAVGGQTITSKILNYDFTGVELVTIMGGANDVDGVVELGTYESTAGDGTICGAMKSIINYIKTNYPKTQVVFIQMTPVGSSADSWGAMYYGKWSLNTYDAEVSTLCHNNHVGYVNWWESLYVDTWIQHSGGYNGDVGPNYSHPKVEEDYALLGDFIGGKISELCKGLN